MKFSVIRIGCEQAMTGSTDGMGDSECSVTRAEVDAEGQVHPHVRTHAGREAAPPYFP